MRGLSKQYYKIHFLTLFKQFKVDSITNKEAQFSAAQRSGFVSAYMEVFNKDNPSRALQLLKGCHEHFWAQVTCMKRNQAVVKF
jgi:hypothetical protein